MLPVTEADAQDVPGHGRLAGCKLPLLVHAKVLIVECQRCIDLVALLEEAASCCCRSKPEPLALACAQFPSSLPVNFNKQPQKHFRTLHCSNQANLPAHNHMAKYLLDDLQMSSSTIQWPAILGKLESVFFFSSVLFACRYGTVRLPLQWRVFLCW